MKNILTLLLACAALGAQAAPQCSADKFVIVSKTGRMDDQFLYVVGKVRNDNPVACGVQLKMEVYDKAKNLIDTRESWPASISNIAAGSTYSFKMHMERARDSKGYSIEVARARAW